LLAIDFFVRKDGRAGRIDVLQVEDKYCGLEVSDANGVGFIREHHSTKTTEG
jgi:hypothetical protein